MPVPENVTQQNPYGPLITFQSQNILPPSAIYVGPNDSIFLQVFAPTVAVIVSLYYRFLRPDGQLISNNRQVTGGGVGNANFALTIAPSEGFLLSMVVSSGATSRGQCFARAFIVPGGLQTVSTFAHLFLQGYASQVDAASFPQGPLESSLNGRGWLRDVIVNGPSQPILTAIVPTGAHWLVRAVNFTVQTSIAVGNRTLVASVTDTLGNNTYNQVAPATIPASTLVTCAFGSGGTSAASNILQSAGFPNEMILPAGWHLQAQIAGGDIADAIQVLFVTVEEFVGQ
jgi:hypothetical protein